MAKKSAEPTASSVPVKTVAAIDVGSNALRMEIGEVLPDGEVRVIDQLQRACRLGQCTFRRGRLDQRTLRAAVNIFRDFRQLLDFYNVQQVRAVATSAVREAGNSDAFIDRVFMTSGLDLQVIDTPEESRLTVSALWRAMGPALCRTRTSALIADVGGGSTLLTMVKGGQIVASQSLPLGSVRLRESLAVSSESPPRTREILNQQIANVVSAAQTSLPLKRITRFVAIGGDARFAARQVGKETASEELHVVSLERFDALVAKCEAHTAEELAKTHGLSMADAETINPALLVYSALLRKTRAKEMLVSQVSMRDGLLLDLGREVTGREDNVMTDGVIHSAQSLARKYHVDEGHGEMVAELACRLFDETQREHGLSGRKRLLLRIAALVHEVGGYVSSRAHHKHSYYLVRHAEVFGLTRDEMDLVAHVARYHRRSGPKPTHTEYAALPRETRMIITKLAAILRAADALDRAHAGHVEDFTVRRDSAELVISVPGVSDLTLERRAMETKGDLFEDIYGLRIRLEELPHSGRRERAGGKSKSNSKAS